MSLYEDVGAKRPGEQYILVASKGAVSNEPFEQEATVKVSISSVQLYLMLSSTEWFSSSITSDMVEIHDCYIVECDAGPRTLRLL